MTKEKTDKVVLAVEMIIDYSGSMACCQKEVVDGVNKFVEEMATAIFPARLGVTLFEDKLNRSLIDGVSAADMPQVAYEQYDPHWGTENIAHCVNLALNKRLAPLDAEHKVLVVLTDGLNRSPQMDSAKANIAKRMSEGWLVIWYGVYTPHYPRYKAMLLEYAKGLGIPDGLTFALAADKIDKAMPLAAQSIFRFLASNGDAKFAGFTKKERGVAD